ncbi:cupin domain-containing protein [Ensifer soli]|uniref:cupin domain-containing protein n=1 Tax=Ciceribacter sp. sgz301302 TaxID=3342379 RepID=UPI0035B9B1E3
MNAFTYAAVSRPGHGWPVGAFGGHVVRLMAATTGGALGLFEATVCPGDGPPWHAHEREDEFFRVLSGRFGFWCAGDYVELGEGGCIALPRGVPHRFRNIGERDGQLMVVVTPGGFEDFFLLIDLCRPETPDELSAIAAEFGLTFPLEGDRKAA